MPGDDSKTIEQLQAELAAAYASRMQGEVRVTSSATSVPAEDPYAPTAWAANEYDFEVPSGQRCRLRKLPVEELVRSGVLDKLTRLPGLTDKVIRTAEGLPPVKEPAEDEMPAPEHMQGLLELLDAILPIVVLKPRVYPEPTDPEQRINGRVYPSSIELADRVAILERSVGGLRDLDKFRN